MKLRQSQEREFLSQIRRVRVGEVDGQIAIEQLEAAPRATYDQIATSICSSIYKRYVEPGGGLLIPKHLFCDVPIWVFLEYAVKFCSVLLHGSPDQFRDELKAERRSKNLIGWDIPRHFAYRSSTEALFGAVLDTNALRRLDCPRKNSVVMDVSKSGHVEKRFYYGIDYRALPHGPWKIGTVYLYRVCDFPEDFDQRPFLSDRPIRPLARVEVCPLDWPLLGKVVGVDVVAMALRTRDSFQGYPWIQDEQVHPRLRQGQQVAAMFQHLEEHLERAVDLTELSKIADTSPFAALRMFRAHNGVTPHQYHVHKRLQQAKELLRRGHLIAEAAVDTGFADQSHLTRQFRDTFGLTPGQYLRMQESSIRKS